MVKRTRLNVAFYVLLSHYVKSSVVIPRTTSQQPPTDVPSCRLDTAAWSLKVSRVWVMFKNPVWVLLILFC